MILISGGIGSGKSVVSRVLRLRGWGVFDCDAVARGLTATESSIASEICEALGENVYHDGAYNKCRVSEIIFSDSEKRAALNKIVHAAVKNELKRWHESSTLNRYVECAIPSESGILELVDEIIYVEAPLEQRILRVGNRDGHTAEKVKTIMKAQSREEAAMRASGLWLTTIRNDGVSSILSQLSS